MPRERVWRPAQRQSGTLVCADAAKPMLSGVFVVDLHLYPHCFLLPEVRHLFRSPPSSELYITIGHVTLRAVHQALETAFVLWVIEMLVWSPWVQPGTTQVTEVGFALCTCHVVTCVWSVWGYNGGNMYAHSQMTFDRAQSSKRTVMCSS